MFPRGFRVFQEASRAFQGISGSSGAFLEVSGDFSRNVGAFQGPEGSQRVSGIFHELYGVFPEVSEARLENVIEMPYSLLSFSLPLERNVYRRYHYVSKTLTVYVQGVLWYFQRCSRGFQSVSGGVRVFPGTFQRVLGGFGAIKRVSGTIQGISGDFRRGPRGL